MTDNKYCPTCKRIVYIYDHTDDPTTCNVCQSDLTEIPLKTQIRRKIIDIVTVIIFAGLLFGPPALAIKTAWGKPLYASKQVTITTTEYYGAIPEAFPIIAVWVFILLIISTAYYGPRV